nr:putative ribonuclease H-like domain-containing protein [Tanacetum cinerariifolium]
MVPTAVLTQSKPVFNTVVRPFSVAMPKINVTQPRHAPPIVTKFKSPIRRHITRSPSPKTSNSLPRVTAVQALVVSVAQGSGPTWLFDIDRLTRTMNYQPVTAGNQPNPSVDAAFNGKEHDFDEKKPESKVNVSVSSSAQTRNQDDKTKKKAKGKNMPELEDITYSDDENNVGAEADFNNLETSITKFWVLVDLPHGKRAIGTKWVYKNKKDERGIVIRNKAILVAQGHTQEEGINYKEVFAPVARIKAIRLFLAYASFMGFMVYQMYIKSAFLYGIIEKEVYVCQPLGFEDPDDPDKVYKVVKALYGLHQAPRAWFETLANYLLENSFQRSKIDQNLFIKKQKGDILLV